IRALAISSSRRLANIVCVGACRSSYVSPRALASAYETTDDLFSVGVVAEFDAEGINRKSKVINMRVWEWSTLRKCAVFKFII
ncbi:21115_t:CDS:1, partial [Rhizophagus irregularis]